MNYSKADEFVRDERHKWEVLVLSREKRDNEAEKNLVFPKPNHV